MPERLGGRPSEARWTTAAALAVVAVVAAVSAATPSAPAHHQPGDVSLEAVTTLQPVGARNWRGVVRLSAHPDGPTQLHGLLLGLLQPAVPAVRVGLAPRLCSRSGTRDLNDIYVLSAPPVRPNGTALLEHRGRFTFAQLRRARSVVLMGDANADGEEEIGACGDLDTHVVDWSGAGGRGVFATAARLDVSDGAPGAGRLLIYDWAAGPDRRSTAVAVTDLTPGTRYALRVARPRSDGSWDHCVERMGAAMGFITDPSGSALLAAEDLNVRRLKDGDALVVAQPSSSAPDVAVCAEVRGGALAERDG